MDESRLIRAVEVFVEGFTFTRSFTHPFLGTRLHDNLWQMKDGPRSGDLRSEEYVSILPEPDWLDREVRQHAGPRWAICVVIPEGEIDTGEPAFRQRFRELGYRLGHSEYFMHHSLATLPAVEEIEGVSIRRVTTVDEANTLAKKARKRQILTEHLDLHPAPQQQYVAWSEGVPIGWVGSVQTSQAGWVSNLYVQPDQRRRGIGRALMSRLLHGDRAAGQPASVLLASHTGYTLYPRVGYELLGRLLIYTPDRSG